MPNQFDKSKLPSRHVSVGPERAPHRSYYYAMGLTAEEIARPFVGVVSAGNDSAPCNTTLDAQADIARVGVEQGGGGSSPHNITGSELFPVLLGLACISVRRGYPKPAVPNASALNVTSYHTSKIQFGYIGFGA